MLSLRYLCCILETLFSTNYTLVPNWQLWGVTAAACIHSIGAACSAHPAPCPGILSAEGLTEEPLVLPAYKGCWTAAWPALCCGRGVSGWMRDLTEGRAFSLSGDEGLVEEACRRLGRGAQLPPPSACLRPAAISLAVAWGSCRWPAESS